MCNILDLFDPTLFSGWTKYKSFIDLKICHNTFLRKVQRVWSCFYWLFCRKRWPRAVPWWYWARRLQTVTSFQLIWRWLTSWLQGRNLGRVLEGWRDMSYTWVVNNNSSIGDVPLDMSGLLWSTEDYGVCNDDLECITVGFIAYNRSASGAPEFVIRSSDSSSL